jgi:hypothetical protein
MNSYTNERVEIADVRGTVAQDLHGAFREWFAESKATKCTEYLYSLSINPDNRQGDLTRDQYMDFIARTEKKLGLAAQPRAVVFHVKKGREHCHVVWSRIDLEKMRAVPLGHDHQKLRSVVQEFARDHGLELPDGMKKDKGKDRYEDRQKDSNLREKQQEERTGETKQERMAAITEAWRQSDNAQAFVQALAGRGYHITRGDKGYVVVDRFGEIHFLGRQIQGAKTKEVTMRLAAEFPLDKLPAVEAVQQHIEEEKKLMLRAGAEKAQEAARAAAGKEQEAAREAEAGERSGKQKTAQPEKTQLTPAQRRAQLEEKQKVRRAVLDARRADMLRIHRIERQALRDMQDVQNTGVANDRLKHQPPGLAAFLLRITGIKALIRYGQDKARAAQHKQQQAALTRKHHREREDASSTPSISWKSANCGRFRTPSAATTSRKSRTTPGKSKDRRQGERKESRNPLSRPHSGFGYRISCAKPEPRRARNRKPNSRPPSTAPPTASITTTTKQKAAASRKSRQRCMSFSIRPPTPPNLKPPAVNRTAAFPAA